VQAKLLTAVEDRAVRRLGSTRPKPADAWLISATNTDLKVAVGARRFLKAKGSGRAGHQKSRAGASLSSARIGERRVTMS
jgi:hypothetical protein